MGTLGSPADQADAADDQLRLRARPEQFVTGFLMRARLADGHAEVVNAGHPAPFLLRDGKVLPLQLSIQCPLGLATVPYRTDTVDLVPGDRLLLVTDGYLDRQAERVDIEGALVTTRKRHPRQVVQELASRLLEVTGGNLRDDATALCLDWYGSAGARASSGGASQARTTQ